MVTLAASAGGSNESIPGYQLLCEVGKGFTAKVYKARQISLDRIVAIKVLPRKLSESIDFFGLFVAKANAASTVHHSNIVQTLDAGRTADGFVYLVIEYVEGRTLFELISPSPYGEGKTFSASDSLNICIQIADALACAHEHGLTHRDVKPKSILLTTPGVAKLTDLGFARPSGDKETVLTPRDKAYGTPYYISPEQIRGDADIDGRTDIYSLGATMYHLMTGRPPFGGETPSAVMYQHLRQALVPADHVNPGLSAGVGEIIDVAMSKRKEDRYRLMAMMLKDMRAVGSNHDDE
jgi:serine/threonine-protein kinase